MMKTITFFMISCLLIGSACNGQQKTTTMNTVNNPLLCNPQSGMCEIPVTETTTTIEPNPHLKKAIRLVYFTDPICSSCWGIEAQLRKLKMEYGHLIEIDYHMGGLLPDWSYNSGGISKPSDVAHHWDEVSAYYDMPIDGDVWLENPLNSSYPPSIAFKAAQLQDNTKAEHFLRRIKEMVFLEKKNIATWENLIQAADECGLDLPKFKSDYDSRAQTLFQEDLALAQKYGVRGFPTIFFTDNLNQKEIIYGVKPYVQFEETLLKIHPEAAKKIYNHSWQQLFAIYPTLTLKEFVELSGLSKPESEKLLNSLTQEQELTKWLTKNGAIWKRNKK